MFKNAEGIEIKPIYRESDIHGLSHLNYAAG
ncbi:MAG: hypothetical protein RI894_413, partial [Bacteroidota bacterium]